RAVRRLSVAAAHPPASQCAEHALDHSVHRRAVALCAQLCGLGLYRRRADHRTLHCAACGERPGCAGLCAAGGEAPMKLDPRREVWMTADKTRAVLAALGGEARFVGGAVRNALLKREVSEVDIATPLTPDEVTKRLRAAGLDAVPTGIEHGTVTAIASGTPFAVTTLRRDVSTDGRRAVVAFTTDWTEDAQRRDFTMNALYAAADGEVFDYVGGVADLEAGKVRFVGDAATRIREDYLRILRLFRFHAWYGRGEIDPQALRAV